ncbi:MAG TPA: hypothetical protein VKB54_17370 [Solirubrobacteraceae bacterium]|nr:hypothetical protein [Solirubrobacteraceae bacterium]
MTELERDLLALGGEVAWPPTPDLATSVQARVAREPRAAGRRSWMPRRLAPVVVAVIVAVLVALGALIAASPDVRATLRDWLGIGSIAVRRVDRLPDVAPARTLDLGRRVTAAQAQRHLDHPLVTVRALGEPDAIYAGDAVVPARVTLVYVARPGLPVASTTGVGALLDEIAGDQLPFAEKLVAGGVPIVRVKVNGAPGLFIGGRHALALPDELHPRLAGNTLLWARDGVTYRLETALGVRRALRLARSVG